VKQRALPEQSAWTRKTYRKRMEMHTDFPPTHTHILLDAQFCGNNPKDGHGRTTAAEHGMACHKKRGDIFAPEALVRTLTLGPRLDNGLPSTLLKFFSPRTEGPCFSPSREDRAPGCLGGQARPQSGCKLTEVSSLLTPPSLPPPPTCPVPQLRNAAAGH